MSFVAWPSAGSAAHIAHVSSDRPRGVGPHSHAHSSPRGLGGSGSTAAGPNHPARRGPPALVLTPNQPHSRTRKGSGHDHRAISQTASPTRRATIGATQAPSTMAGDRRRQRRRRPRRRRGDLAELCRPGTRQVSDGRRPESPLRRHVRPVRRSGDGGSTRRGDDRGPRREPPRRGAARRERRQSRRGPGDDHVRGGGPPAGHPGPPVRHGPQHERQRQRRAGVGVRRLQCARPHRCLLDRDAGRRRHHLAGADVQGRDRCDVHGGRWTGNRGGRWPPPRRLRGPCPQSAAADRGIPAQPRRCRTAATIVDVRPARAVAARRRLARRRGDGGRRRRGHAGRSRDTRRADR